MKTMCLMATADYAVLAESLVWRAERYRSFLAFRKLNAMLEQNQSPVVPPSASAGISRLSNTHGREMFHGLAQPNTHGCQTFLDETVRGTIARTRAPSCESFTGRAAGDATGAFAMRVVWSECPAAQQDEDDDDADDARAATTGSDPATGGLDSIAVEVGNWLDAAGGTASTIV